MTKSIKRILTVFVAALMCTVCICFAACTGATGATGAPGKDGQDVSIYDIYEATNEARVEKGLERLSFLEFIEQYLGYVADNADTAASLQSVINYSLLSCVSIVTEYDTIVNGSNYYAGSGVIVDIDKDEGDAYIVTNAHVVSEYQGQNRYYADKVYVHLYGYDSDSYIYIGSSGSLVTEYGIEAEVIGMSLTYDLAVLKITGSEILQKSSAVAARFAEEDELYAGASVYAIGFPGGDGMSVTQGIISLDSEYIYVDTTYDSTLYRVVRTDTAINGGNSGGGLFNTSGEVVGIVNSKDESDGTDNISYALPSSYARRVVQSMIDNYESTNTAVKYVNRYMLNIATSVINVSTSYDSDECVVKILETVQVNQIYPDSITQGYFKYGDIIQSVSIGTGVTQSGVSDEKNTSFEVPQDVAFKVARHYYTQEITRSYMLQDIMLSVRQGDTLEIEILRDNQTMYVYIYFSANVKPAQEY